MTAYSGRVVPGTDKLAEGPYEVVQTDTGHEHRTQSGMCTKGAHTRCRVRSQYDARCTYVCTCDCHGPRATGSQEPQS